MLEIISSEENVYSTIFVVSRFVGIFRRYRIIAAITNKITINAPTATPTINPIFASIFTELLAGHELGLQPTIIFTKPFLNGHSSPPFEDTVLIIYVWVCVPKPHETEQLERLKEPTQLITRAGGNVVDIIGTDVVMVLMSGV